MKGVCLANDVGRTSWIESLGPEPTGDCVGQLGDLLDADASLCERHYLQYSLAGRKFGITFPKR